MELKFINVEKRVDDTIVFPAFNLHTNERLTVIEHLKFFQQLYNNDIIIKVMFNKRIMD